MGEATKRHTNKHYHSKITQGRRGRITVGEATKRHTNKHYHSKITQGRRGRITVGEAAKRYTNKHYYSRITQGRWGSDHCGGRVQNVTPINITTVESLMGGGGRITVGEAAKHYTNKTFLQYNYPWEAGVDHCGGSSKTLHQ